EQLHLLQRGDGWSDEQLGRSDLLEGARRLPYALGVERHRRPDPLCQLAVVVLQVVVAGLGIRPQREVLKRLQLWLALAPRLPPGGPDLLEGSCRHLRAAAAGHPADPPAHGPLYGLRRRAAEEPRHALPVDRAWC